MKHHVCLATHKAAVALSTEGLGGTAVVSNRHMAVAASTVDECKELLSTAPTAAQAATLARFQAGIWPPASDAPHVAPVPGLSVRSSWFGCYSCAVAAPTMAELAKKHKSAKAAGSPSSACVNSDWYPVAVQTLQQGKKLRLFPVVYSRVASSSAPTTAPRGAAAPSSVTLPLDVFLRRGRRGGAAVSGARLQTTEATSLSQSEALLRAFKFDDRLREMQWTADGVVDHSAFLPPSPAGQGGGGAGGGAAGVGRGRTEAVAPAISPSWQLFCALKVAVNDLASSALRHLRTCDLTSAAKLVVGAGTDAHAASAGRPLNVHLQDSTVARYAHDTALALYTVVRVADLGALTDAKALADGRQVPTLSYLTTWTAGKVRAALEASMSVAAAAAGPRSSASATAAGGNADGSRPTSPPPSPTPPPATTPSPSPPKTSPTGELVGKKRDFAEPVSLLMHAVFHEQYDPRVVSAGGEGKARAEVSLVMPFLALRYPRSSSASPRLRQDGEAEVTYMDASGAQHLAAALLFATRVVNALFFFRVGRPVSSTMTGRPKLRGSRPGTLAEAFHAISEATDPTANTAAAYIVMLYSRADLMSRAQAVAPAFLPCDEPSHASGGPPTAVCGTLLDRGFHLSTVKLGELATSLQADLWRRFQALTWGYDPTGSGFFTQAVHLVDQPSFQTPGVSFLQLPANQPRVRGWQAHVLASEVLDSPACPVRPAYKLPESATASGGSCGGGSSAGASAAGAQGSRDAEEATAAGPVEPPRP